MFTRRLNTLTMLIVGLAAAMPLYAEEAKDAGWASKAHGVLRQYCYRCHNSAESEGGFDILNPSAWAEHKRLIAGKPSESLIVDLMHRKAMPPLSVTERPSAEQMASVEKWIESGAPPFVAAAVKARTPIPLAVVLTAIRDDLRSADRETRPYLRYFTIHHLYNNPRMMEDDLAVYRSALSMAVNSLSWKPRIVIPRTVAKTYETIYAIDIRDLDWDRGHQWQKLLAAYPYGLKYANYPEPELQKLDDDIALESNCELPWIRADWFATTATRPPLYEDLLGLPTNARELEKRLKVDIAANFTDPKPERIARAGFPKSGVSGQNRLLERNEAEYGAYWKSYDFKPENPKAKLARYPLGPLNLFADGKHPYARQAFVHDGGEVIFHLPNGMLGYYLCDGKDGRIEEGPVAVVSDAQKTSGTPAIVTGVSCMSCHCQGFKPFKDTIRSASAVFGEAERKVIQLYPEQAQMDRLLQDDNDRYQTALKKALSAFVPQGADPNRFHDPIGEVARLHRLVYIDLETVAHELDIVEPQAILQKVGEKKLKLLGLESLARQGGVVGRNDWEAGEGVSLMQELARELRYTPVRSIQ